MISWQDKLQEILDKDLDCAKDKSVVYNYKNLYLALKNNDLKSAKAELAMFLQTISKINPSDLDLKQYLITKIDGFLNTY